MILKRNVPCVITNKSKEFEKNIWLKFEPVYSFKDFPTCNKNITNIFNKSQYKSVIKTKFSFSILK